VSSLELSELVRARLPQAQILFTSGYAEGVLSHDGKLPPGVNLLQKPYTVETLSSRIRHLLRRPGAPHAHRLPGRGLHQADTEDAVAGRWPLLSPWLHSSALPAFAVLSVLCALVWGAVRRWLAEYEEYVQASVERALRLVGRALPAVARPHIVRAVPPRRIFGLAFESRPPPLFA
jgi:hypothetical protein